jgi:hypothetical protein
MTAISSHLKRNAGELRASAALPASGAYDTAANATVLDVQTVHDVTLYCKYTPGATGGRFKLEVLASDDGVDYATLEVLDGSTLSAGVIDSGALQTRSPASSGTTVEHRAYDFNVRRAGWIKVIACEAGVTGTPGTLRVRAVTS